MKEFDDLSKEMYRDAEFFAINNQHSELTVSHIIYIILKNSEINDFIVNVLKNMKIDVGLLMESVVLIISELPKSSTKIERNSITPHKQLVKVLVYATENKIELANKELPSIEDIFFAALNVKSELSQILLDFTISPLIFLETSQELDDLFEDVDDDDMYEYVGSSASGKPNSKQTKAELLNTYCSNLNLLAKTNKIDPCYGREVEINRLCRILSRTRKGNAILIGHAGVGKTNIVEGLVMDIVKGNIPENLKKKTIYSLDLNAVVAGTKYRGMFEERIQGILDELITNGDAILFIDEIHNIMGAGSAEGTMDFSNILKPYIARAELQIIGATTISEYKKHIEPNKAIQRRFSEVLIEEPTHEVCIKILNSIKPKYEKHHYVTYSDEAIEACVTLGDKYLTYRHLPDKAIDLLDDVAVKMKMEFGNSKELLELQKQFENLEEIKKKIISTKSYEKAELVLLQSKQIFKKIQQLQNTKGKSKTATTITEDDVRSLIQEMTKIPLNKVGLDLKTLKAHLCATIIGQNEAIELVTRTLMINQLHLDDDEKPIGSFLFVGYSGVGKTQLVKELSLNLFGNTNSLMRIDCSEFAQPHEVSKLIGSPVGYVGYEEGGLLTERVRRNPFTVILFDEIEKAHEKLFDILLQILGEGRLTDNRGEVINFKNTIIVLTSNLGTSQAAKNIVSYINSKDAYNTQEIEKAIKKKFKPEFVNRIDNIVHFNVVSKESLLIILELELEKLIKQVAKHGATLYISNEVKGSLVEHAYIPENGVRALKRQINDNIKNVVAESLLNGDCDELYIELENEKIIILDKKKQMLST